MATPLDKLTPLERRMRSVCITMEDFASALGIGTTALVQKKKGRRPFTIAEMMKLSRILNLTAQETFELFAADELTNKDRKRLFGG
jgi:transcriptional regulator with XRE-family HTH domain